MNEKAKELPPHPLEHLVEEALSIKSAPDWIVRIARVGIVIGCVGGLLGGISTLCDLWKRWTAKPKIEVITGSDLRLLWNRQQRILSFVRGIVIQNTGDEIGQVVATPRAWLESAAFPGTRELRDIEIGDRHDAVWVPVSVKASDSKDFQFTMATKFAEEDEPLFPKEGVYRLYFSLNTPTTPEPDVYCFRLTQQQIGEIEGGGSMRFLASTDSCSG